MKNTSADFVVKQFVTLLASSNEEISNMREASEAIISCCGVLIKYMDDPITIDGIITILDEMQEKQDMWNQLSCLPIESGILYKVPLGFIDEESYKKSRSQLHRVLKGRVTVGLSRYMIHLEKQLDKEVEWD